MKAVITDTELEYEGSITIDKGILEKANILPYEKVQVVNLSNGNRLETYTIPADKGSKTVCLNGPAARKGESGDRIIIISYAIAEEDEFTGQKPKVISLDENNKILE